MACALIEKHKDEFFKDCTKIIDEGIAKFGNSDNGKCEITDSEIIDRLNVVHTQAEKGLLNAFKEQTNRAAYSQMLKTEYEDRIKSNLEWVKNLKISDWKNIAAKNVQKAKFDENSKKFNEKIAKMLKDCVDFQGFKKQMENVFANQNREFNQRLKETYESYEKSLDNLMVTYNSTIELLRGSEIFQHAQ